MASPSESIARLVTVDADDAMRDGILQRLAASRAVLTGHFALHRGRHSTTALRFRGVGRDPQFMRDVVEAIVARASSEIVDALPGATLLTPQSSGFFLGRALAARYRTPHVVAQTDLSRRPIRTLLSGAIRPRDRVILVNDVASTGASLDPLREIVTERGGLTAGVVLFAVVGRTEFESYCAKWQLASRWLVTARWETYAPEVCPGCKAGDPLIPVTEFV